MSFEETPELSVVVPFLNEEGNLPSFLRQISLQRQLRLELILSDGGSADRGVPLANSLSRSLPFAVKVTAGARGRGAQMNKGASSARAATLLFLHIDSVFPDPLAFRKALDALCSAAPAVDGKVAGRFALSFSFEAAPPLPYRFYGAKATLDRPGCTHGDQGLLIGSAFFNEMGSFDETLPLMEDTFLAERIRQSGRLLLLPARIETSPRRFLTEGLLPRQTLNAILMNLAFTGHLELIRALRECYLSQHAARRLELRPFLETLRIRIAQLPSAERRRLWRVTGGYVRSNAWQIPFLLDVLLGRGGEGSGGSLLALHDRFPGRLVDNPAGDWAAAALTWCWFRAALLFARRPEQRESAGR